MTTVYAVFKQGVYRQECAGIFATSDDADKAAMVSIIGEPDDYHTFEVVPFAIGEMPTRPESCEWPNGIAEPGAACTYSRNGESVYKTMHKADK